MHSAHKIISAMKWLHDNRKVWRLRDGQHHNLVAAYQGMQKDGVYSKNTRNKESILYMLSRCSGLLEHIYKEGE